MSWKSVIWLTGRQGRWHPASTVPALTSFIYPEMHERNSLVRSLLRYLVLAFYSTNICKCVCRVQLQSLMQGTRYKLKRANAHFELNWSEELTKQIDWNHKALIWLVKLYMYVGTLCKLKKYYFEFFIHFLN